MIDANKSQVLAKIIMVAGTSKTWKFPLVRYSSGKTSVPSTDVQDYTGVLCVAPKRDFPERKGHRFRIPVTFTKEAVFIPDNDGNAVMTFAIDDADTIGLVGDFVYQIEVDTGVSHCIAQGDITFIENINR